MGMVPDYDKSGQVQCKKSILIHVKIIHAVIKTNVCIINDLSYCLGIVMQVLVFNCT